MLEHEGSFRTPMDQIDFIVKTLKKGSLPSNICFT